jgi:hypothetical protein
MLDIRQLFFFKKVSGWLPLACLPAKAGSGNGLIEPVGCFTVPQKCPGRGRLYKVRCIQRTLLFPYFNHFGHLFMSKSLKSKQIWSFFFENTVMTGS